MKLIIILMLIVSSTALALEVFQPNPPPPKDCTRTARAFVVTDYDRMTALTFVPQDVFGDSYNVTFFSPFQNPQRTGPDNIKFSIAGFSTDTDLICGLASLSQDPKLTDQETTDLMVIAEQWNLYHMANKIKESIITLIKQRAGVKGSPF